MKDEDKTLRTFCWCSRVVIRRALQDGHLVQLQPTTAHTSAFFLDETGAREVLFADAPALVVVAGKTAVFFFENEIVVDSASGDVIKVENE